MPKNEEGEFELILGNRQLLSVFFIVVVLLGVFFTMGYIVGRNSPLATAEATPVEKKESKPMMVDSAASRESASAKETASKDAPVQETAPPAPTATAPQQPGESKPVAQMAKREPPASKPEPVKEPLKSSVADRPSGNVSSVGRDLAA